MQPPIPEKDVSQDLTYDPVSFEGKGNQTHVYDPVDYDDKEDKKNQSPSLLSSRSPLSPGIYMYFVIIHMCTYMGNNLNRAQDVYSVCV